MSHVKPALNRTLLQLPNQILIFPSLPLSSPLHPSKRSVCSYFLCSFLLRLPCFILFVLFPLHLLLLFCCRRFFAPTSFLSFFFSFLFLLLFISFFSSTFAVGNVSAAFCRTEAALVSTSQYPQHLVAPQWHLNFSPCVIHLFLFMTQQRWRAHGFLIFEVSSSHSDTPHSAAIPWTSPSHRRLSENTKTHKRQLSLPPADSNPQS